MRFSKLVSLLISFIFVLSVCTAAFAADRPIIAAFYKGTVKTSGGNLVGQGVVKVLVDNKLKGQVDLSNGQYDYLVVEGDGTMQDKPVSFLVTVNGVEYTAVTDPKDVLWIEGDIKDVNLVIALPEGQQTSGGTTTSSGGSATGQIQVNVEPLNITLKVGETKHLSVTTNIDGAQKSYSSGNVAIATVSSDGLVTAVSNGATTINISATKTGYTNGAASVPVTVSESAPVVIDPNGQPGNVKQFSDVLSTHWAKDVISGLCQRAIIGGYDDGTFRPANNITRAEFTVILAKAVALAEDKPAAPTYKDVAPGAWYYGAVEAAVKAGLIKGYGTGEFRPEDRITKQEMATILVRALKMENDAAARAAEKTTFSDDPAIASWARGFVAVAVQQGLVSGNTDNTFKPDNNATRAEACAMTYKLIEKKK